MKRTRILLLPLALILLITAICGCATCQHRDIDDNDLCDKCSEAYTDGIDVAHSHTFGDWENLNITPSTTHCEKRRFRRICSVCGHNEIRDGSYDDHAFSVTTTLPTCTTEGYDTKTCSLCGFTETLNKTDPVTHSYVEAANNSFHWSECIYCQSKTDEAEHTPTPENTCSICTHTIGATEGIIYELSEEGSYAIVKGYTGSATRVIIADTYQGIPVKLIYSNAFYDCTDLTSIVIPDSVVEIGYSAFRAIENLKYVNIGSGVQNIGSYAFYYCSGLLEITVDENNTAYKSIDGNLYSKDGKILVEYAMGKPDRIFRIPDGVKSIADCSFSRCYNLTCVTIPDSVTSIGGEAFMSCPNLSSVEIGTGLTSIGNSAFGWAQSLIEVINHSNCDIRKGSFSRGDYYGTYPLDVHKGESKLVNYLDYMFYTYEGANYLVGYIGSETDLVLPEAYNGENYEIYNYAFNSRDDISSITIPDGVTGIGAGAFEGCSLDSITLGKGVTSIGSGAFYWCTGLTSVHISDIAVWCNIQFEINSINSNFYSNPLYHAKKLYLNGELVTELVIPEGVEKIGPSSFPNCTCITSVIIPESVTSIDYMAFSDCTNLTSVKIGNGDTSIGNYAFNGCTNLTSFIIGNGVTSIGERAFWGCESLESIVIPESVTSIGSYAFYNCSGLTIYCEAKSKPEGWDSKWNPSYCDVVWGYEIPEE